MSRSKRFVGAASIGIINQVVYTAAGFLLTPFLLVRVGQHDFGLWAVALQVTTYLGLLDLGVVTLLPRDTAAALGRGAGGDVGEEVRSVIGRAARIVLWQLPVVAAVTLLLWVLLPAEWSALRGPTAAVLFSFVLLFPTRLVLAALTGLQDQAFAGWLQLGAYVAGTVVMVVLVLGGAGLPALASSWLITQVINAVGWWIRLRAKFRWAIPASLPHMPWAEAREYLARSLHVTVSQLAVVLVAGTDLIIIGKLLGPQAVVPYMITAKLVAVMANQPHLFMQVALPGLAELRAANARAQVFTATTALGQAIMTMSGALFCLVLLVNRPFVAWWVDSAQYGGAGLTLALLLHMTLRHWNTVLSFTAFALGDERRLSRTTLADGAATVLLSLLLVRLLGPLGAPLAGIIGVSVVSLPSNLRAVARDLTLPVSQLVSPLGGWFVRALPLAIACGALSRVGPPPTFFWLAAASAGILVLYALVLAPVALRPPLGDYARPRIAAVAARLRAGNGG